VTAQPKKILLANLAVGPSTTAELEAILGWPRSLIAAHLSAMAKQGKVTHRQFSAQEKPTYLWSLASYTSETATRRAGDTYAPHDNA
jgi:predicted ArsR family transcriptional regulator